MGLSSPEGELEALIERVGAALAHRTSRQAVLQTKAGLVKWERHSEFVAWTLFIEGPQTGVSPPDWWSMLSGDCIASLEVAIANPTSLENMNDGAAPDFARARVGGGLATARSDFRIAEDGRTHILIEPHRNDPPRLGRLIRRLIELETYRNMALLALPAAQDALRSLDRLEEDLRALSSALPAAADNDADARLLGDLSAIAARLERLRCDVSFRLSAADAYAALFTQRVGELREERIEGSERLSVFLNRRFAPAMATCTSLAKRLDAAALRVDRVSALLRTRVDVAVEGQNSALLNSMNERAAAQLRLQQTVEGLSVFAIAYYLTGLLERPAAALAPYWPWLHSPLAPALIALGAVAVVWFGLRRLKTDFSGAQR